MERAKIGCMEEEDPRVCWNMNQCRQTVRRIRQNLGGRAFKKMRKDLLHIFREKRLLTPMELWEFAFSASLANSRSRANLESLF